MQLTPLNVDTICHEGKSKTVSCSPVLTLNTLIHYISAGNLLLILFMFILFIRLHHYYGEDYCFCHYYYYYYYFFSSQTKFSGQTRNLYRYGPQVDLRTLTQFQ